MREFTMNGYISLWIFLQATPRSLDSKYGTYIRNTWQVPEEVGSIPYGQGFSLNSRLALGIHFYVLLDIAYTRGTTKNSLDFSC